MQDTDPHITGITKSWANKDIADVELGVMIRRDRIGRRGGYLKNLLRLTK